MVKIKMNQQRKLSRHNSRQSSIGETASVGSSKSVKSASGSSDYSPISGQPQQSAKLNSSSHKMTKHGSQESADSGSQSASILNVAEMLLHGVADNEILDIWLRSIQCEEFVAKFIDAGYDMPTISRITPQDLTAIGVTDPSKRLKILAEIKKLNLQDGIPNFKPASLSHWLSLIRLDSYYYKSLCDQQIDTLEKLCQLTWEDFEELGITKLGHQKRFQIAIERVRELEAESKSSSKTMSEPIYDTSPSQILLVASTENHSMNGPVINKQSSTSELSSTGSGSMHSVYSSASTHYQPTYAPLGDNQQTTNVVNHQQLPNGVNQNNQQSHALIHQSQQAIYSSRAPPPMIYQQPSPIHAQQQHQQQQSHYQPVQQPTQQNLVGSAHLTQFMNGNTMANSSVANGATVPQPNRQSMMNQLPFSALANLPKHQQQLLQQSSIYATLSRQPSKAKQPPPPVPIRTNSLKSNSLTDDADKNQRQQPHQQQQEQQQLHNYQHQLNNCNSNLTTSPFRLGNRLSTKPFNSQTMLTKNKSFSGNAYMEASRARFLNRNSHQPFQQFNVSHNIIQNQTTPMNQNNGSNHCINQNFTQGTHIAPGFRGNNIVNGLSNDEDSCRQLPIHNNYNHHNNLQQMPHNPQRPNGSSHVDPASLYHGDDFDIHSDTNSTKSLILPASSSSLVTSPVAFRGQSLNGSSQDSGSSQTIYNSASSGSNNDQSLNNIYNLSQPAESGLTRSAVTTASSCTLNDANLTLERQHNPSTSSSLAAKGILPSNTHYNATTGKDDDFPPPPSPLSLTDSDEHYLVSLNSDSSNFTDVNHGLMTFRVGI